MSNQEERIEALLDRIADPTTTAEQMVLLENKLKVLRGNK